MSDAMQQLGKKLDEITQKLDIMTDGITKLTSTTQSLNEELGANLQKLAETIDRYIDSINQHSTDDFEITRKSIAQVTKEINSLNQATGIEQLMRVNQALTGLLSLLSQAVDPNSIQAKLSEITAFIKSYGGQT
jgi:flagellar biosynthesis regulator FlaF